MQSIENMGAERAIKRLYRGAYHPCWLPAGRTIGRDKYDHAALIRHFAGRTPVSFRRQGLALDAGSHDSQAESPAAAGAGKTLMERIWLRHYPAGVAADIDPSSCPSLTALFEQSFARYAARPCCQCMGRTLSYADLDETSRALAAWLQGCGLERGARVAVMMPNILQYPIAIAAILRAGFTVVNVNPLYTPRELAFQLSDAGAEAIVVLENFASVLQEALPQTKIKHVVVASLGDMLGTVKGTLVNGVVRHVKRMVPSYALPDAIRFNRCA